MTVVELELEFEGSKSIVLRCPDVEPSIELADLEDFSDLFAEIGYLDSARDFLGLIVERNQFVERSAREKIDSVEIQQQIAPLVLRHQRIEFITKLFDASRINNLLIHETNNADAVLLGDLDTTLGCHSVDSFLSNLESIEYSF